jgi:hypothetical protein
MMPDELDEILRSDETIEPSPGFVSVVMRAVYRESTELPPLRFPWSRFGIGVAACALMTWSAGALWSHVEVSAPRVLIHLASVSSVLPQLAYAAATILITLALLSLPRLTGRDA